MDIIKNSYYILYIKTQAIVYKMYLKLYRF